MFDSDRCECAAACYHECVCDWVVKKEWQGLSDDEIVEALSGTDPNFIHGSCIQGILWAEAKLKEKNA